MARLFATSLLLSIVVSSVLGATSGQETSPRRSVPNAAGRANTPAAGARGPGQAKKEAQSDHPLLSALQWAEERYTFIRAHIQDFACILVKHERIDGRLRRHEYLVLKVRTSKVQDGRVVTPLGVYVHYLAPSQLRGRRAVYVAGRDGNRILVRKGGPRLNYVKIKIAPDSDAARRQSRYPITEIGFDTVVKRLIERARADIAADPAGTNTRVAYFKEATVAGRTCTQIQIEHPKRQSDLSFHLANLFVDDELQVPIRVEGYDWPKAPGDNPPLLEEYTYTHLKLNVGLTDADFSSSRLD